jgi:plasmid stabilization system protein ParE
MARVIWSAGATSSLRVIERYIAQDSERHAHALVDRIVAATRRLADFPESGRVVPEQSDPHRRELIVGDYRVFYRLVGPDVYITNIRHGARRLPVDFV